MTTAIICSCGQSNHLTADKAEQPIETADSIVIDTSRIKRETFSHDSYIHTEADYTDSTGKGIIIQNSYPRGGGLIYTKGIQQYGHAVFWTRVVNKTDKTLELNVHFPADSILVYPSPHAHFKLLVPPDTMTLDQVSVFGFGLENIKTFVESNFHQASQIRRTIPSNEESIFYVVLLSHLPTSDQGVSRTGLFLNEQNLFYRLSSPLGVKFIPCGRITFQE